MKKLPILLLAAAIVALPLSCTKDQDKPADDMNDAAYYVKLAEQMLAENNEEVEFRGTTVTVPAGSHNALQAAINQAGNNGTVILATGEHTEDSGVLITQKMNIKGQSGAVVRFNTQPSPTGTPAVIDPGFHIKNANQVVIENLEIQNMGELAGVAIFIENSNNTRIRNNTIGGHYMVIVQDYGNNTRVHDNTLNWAQSWVLLNVNGKNLQIYDNDMTGPIFVGDKGGLIKDNHFSFFLGVLFCTPADALGGPGYIQRPDGTYSNAEASANHWLCIHNTAENVGRGFLVIDGAHDNKLVNNNVIDPWDYGVEMAGASDRYGWPMPTSYNNLTISTTQPHVTIKVCGVNNQAVGGTLIDLEADPCY